MEIVRLVLTAAANGTNRWIFNTDSTGKPYHVAIEFKEMFIVIQKQM